MIKKEFLLPKKTIELGADYLVIGRPIIESKNPLETIKKNTINTIPNKIVIF